MHVDISPPRRRGTDPHSFGVAAQSDFIPKSAMWRQGKRSNSGTESLAHTTAARGPKSTSTVITMLIICTLDKMRWIQQFTCGLPSKNTYNLIMRTDIRQILTDFYKLLDQYSSRLSELLKTKWVWETVTGESVRALSIYLVHITRCWASLWVSPLSVVSWKVGSWARAGLPDMSRGQQLLVDGGV